MLPVTAPQPPTRLRNAVARPILALLAVVAAILACGATPSFLQTAPAHELQLGIQLIDAFVAGNAPVRINVLVSDPSRGGFISLSGGQRLTCDGVSDPATGPNGHSWNRATFLVPRQPPGGAYICVYTDESGVQTSLGIPVPLEAVMNFRAGEAIVAA